MATDQTWFWNVNTWKQLNKANYISVTSTLKSLKDKTTKVTKNANEFIYLPDKEANKERVSSGFLTETIYIFLCARRMFTVVMPIKDSSLYLAEGRMNFKSSHSWLKQVPLFTGQESLNIKSIESGLLKSLKSKFVSLSFTTQCCPFLGASTASRKESWTTFSNFYYCYCHNNCVV